jgi:hypothetical protein
MSVHHFEGDAHEFGDLRQGRAPMACAEGEVMELVLPILRRGPAMDSPSAASSFSLPPAVWVMASRVTGPVFTRPSTLTPLPRLP